MGCLKNLITRNTPEWFISSKNMCIYRQIWAWPLDLALHLESTAKIKHLHVNRCH